MTTQKQQPQTQAIETAIDITGSQSAAAGGTLASGQAAVEGTTSITGSINQQTVDRYAGGAPKDFGNPKP